MEEIWNLFKKCPLNEINKILFQKQQIEIEDVAPILMPVYSEDTFLEVQKSVLRQNLSTGKSEGVLVDVIGRLAQEHPCFLNEFIHFASGYDFIPYQGFKITVVFDHGEMSADHLPVSYSSNNTLKIPAQAYDGNAEMLETKLLTSIMCISTENCEFDMH